MGTTYYHWDDVDDCVTHETDNLGATIVTYTHEPGQFGPLISETRAGTTFTHHYDAFGSTTMLTDDAGAVTDGFTYDAWGNQVAHTGTTPTRYQWVGRMGYQFDSVMKPYYVRAIRYEVATARWTSKDPARLFFIITMYQYGNSNPLTAIDPTGMITITPIYQYLKALECNDDASPFIEWHFDLDNPAKCDGWLVQQVEIRCRRSECHPCPNTSSMKPDIVFWEAWQIKDAKKHEDRDKTNDATDRSTGFRPENGTCGLKSALKTINFFCEKQKEDENLPGDLNSDWNNGSTYSGGDCSATSWGLPSTQVEPTWWGKEPSEGTANRAMT